MFLGKKLQKISCKTLHWKIYFAWFIESVSSFLSKIVLINTIFNQTLLILKNLNKCFEEPHNNQNTKAVALYLLILWNHLLNIFMFCRKRGVPTINLPLFSRISSKCGKVSFDWERGLKKKKEFDYSFFIFYRRWIDRTLQRSLHKK